MAAEGYRGRRKAEILGQPDHPKSDTATIEEDQAAIQAAYEEGTGKLKGTSKSVPPLSTLKTPLRDGDTERPDDPLCEQLLRERKLHHCSRRGRCRPSAIIDTSEVYSGVYGRASINFYAYATKRQKASPAA